MNKLLDKGAIEPVPFVERHFGFYSTMVSSTQKVSRNKTCDKPETTQPVLKDRTFQNGHTEQGVQSSKKGDRTITVDLRDAYFHIPIFRRHRKFLRFCIQGRAYQYRSLAFAPKTSPRVFTKIESVVAAHFRTQGIRLAVYLDNWLALNAIRRLLLQDRQKILNLLSQIGFLINAEKSELIPT